MYVIPAVDILDGNVVRLVKGNPADKVVYGNDPVEIAKKWENAGADSLHVVDLDATLRTGRKNAEYVSRIIDAVKIPVEVAGGIRSIPAVNEMFRKNAAKVVLGTMAYKNPESIRKLAKKNQRKIIVSLDQNNGNVMIDGWRESTGSSVIDSMAFFMDMGIREFLLTSVDRDGTMNGPDITTLSSAVEVTSANIIASGGISSVEDAIKVRNVGCSAVILGKALYEGRLSVEKVKAIA
ncbi:MAG TPA: 1-(5-phosphoribosyl)-5-[(5-phosphoribosylamino)methylideneamino]imidazole-4-carboxamide isomerase [Candidatus Bathyarchaeia archaeon]|nr:1-(5-phosphoribosyl)-5-[(5-phosphoribosylamino)methylideneamino]imidazole-4-carboxamide isomerase [Candidatus Bathyarchaeia archaeon]